MPTSLQKTQKPSSNYLPRSGISGNKEISEIIKKMRDVQDAHKIACDGLVCAVEGLKERVL